MTPRFYDQHCCPFGSRTQSGILCGIYAQTILSGLHQEQITSIQFCLSNRSYYLHIAQVLFIIQIPSQNITTPNKSHFTRKKPVPFRFWNNNKYFQPSLSILRESAFSIFSSLYVLQTMLLPEHEQDPKEVLQTAIEDFEVLTFKLRPCVSIILSPE